MRVAQIIASDPTPLESREQRLDLAALEPLVSVLVLTADPRGRATEPGRPGLDLTLRRSGATVAHLYSRSLLTRRVLARIPVPLVAPATPAPSRLPWLRIRQPDRIASDAQVPPAVPAEYFQPPTANKGGTRVGVLVRDAEGMRAFGATRQRIERFRDDVSWRTFPVVPDPMEMRLLDVWIDPTPTVGWGGIPEAMAAGVPVITARGGETARLMEDGQAGFLIPPGDANELAHAIFAALFRPEVTIPKRQRASELASRFRPERRAEALLGIYRELSP